MSDLIELRNRSFEFSTRCLADAPKRVPQDSTEFQRAFVYQHASACLRSARSYWLLRDASYNHDANVIARTLLEHVLSVIYSADSPSKALDLLGFEMREYKKRLGLFPSPDPAGFTLKIAEIDKDLATLAKMKGSPLDGANINVLEQARRAGFESLYRSFYFHLSNFAHATSRDPDAASEPPIASSDWLSLIAPVAASSSYHGLSCEEDSCPLEAEYLMLKIEISEVNR